MIRIKHAWVLAVAISLAAGACSNKKAEEEAAAAAAAAAQAALVADALSAAHPKMAATAKVVDWDGNVLKEGTGAYTCLPSPKELGGTAPMCMDHHWMAWADAWANHKEFTAGGLGISYMLAGDGGASNIDPYAMAETPDNQWIVEGPHLMVIVPDAALLEGLSTDPWNGGPYVMWKGTPYAHVMVPVNIPSQEGIETPLADALSAANVAMAANAKVVDWDGKVLQEGTGAYTCLPSSPELSAGRAPMCMDGPWMKWADAWAGHKDFKVDQIGIAYMLAGDEGASNIDPYATAETPDNQWVVEGAHVMILVPDPALLEGISTDPFNGGPYVMHKGTPHAHVMVPVAN